MGIVGETQSCINCKVNVPRTDMRARGRCIPCDRVNTLIGWAQGRAEWGADAKQDPVTLGQFARVLSCQVSGVPMVFTDEESRNLKGASLYRIDNTAGYTKKQYKTSVPWGKSTKVDKR